jgi:hypothetical protein
MRRAPIIVSAIASTLVLAVLLVLGIVSINGDRLGLVAAFSSSDAGDVFGPQTSEDDDWGPTQTYDVLDDGSLSPAASGLTEEVWEAFTRVASPEVASKVILTFTVGDSQESDLLAYVQQDADRPEYWHFAANLSGASDMSYLLTTLIHEYAHILTLDLGQASADPTCDVQTPSEGCWLADSYLQAYWNEFWSVYGDDAPSITNEDDSLREAFYTEHEEDFVSGYAAKSVEEDIAESFMAYVIEDVPDSGQSTVAAKLAFFDRYPELAAIRERIRAEFGDQLRPVWDA